MNIFTILRSEQVEVLGVQASQYVVIGTVALPCRLIIDFLFNSNFFQGYYEITKCIIIMHKFQNFSLNAIMKNL